MVEVYNEYGGNVVAVTEVPREKTSSYGIVDIEKDDGKLVTISGVVESRSLNRLPLIFQLLDVIFCHLKL